MILINNIYHYKKKIILINQYCLIPISTPFFFRSLTLYSGACLGNETFIGLSSQQYPIQFILIKICISKLI